MGTRRTGKATRRGEKGQAVVEMALVLPVLVLLVVGTMEFGRLFGAYLTIAHAAREGARLGIAGASDAEIEDAVRGQAEHLDGAADPQRLVVSVSPPAPERVPGETTLTVTVTYEFRFVLPWIVGRTDPSFPLRSSLSMKM